MLASEVYDASRQEYADIETGAWMVNADGQRHGADRPLKILRVIARLNVGGPARHVVLLNRGLQSRGHSAVLIHGAVGPGEASLEHLAEEGDVRVMKVSELGPRINAFSDAVAFLKLVRITFREAPDVVHTHTAKAGTLARLAAFLYNVTRPRSKRALVVHTFHGHVLNGYFGTVGNALVRAAERSLGTMTDCIVTIAPSQWRDIVHTYRVAPADRVVTIPLGLNLEPLLKSTERTTVDLRNANQIAADAFVFGYVGRFVPIKDLGTMLAAFRIASRAVPNAWLLLVGDGPTRAQLEDQAAAYGLADRVVFAGWTNDLPSVYRAMDVCVLSSLNEGTPVAIIEAMAAGRPVIATSVGGVPDVVDAGRTGVLVPPSDPQQLSDAMVSLAQQPDVRAAMTMAARAEVAERFSHERLVKDIEGLYDERLSVKRQLARG